MEVKILVIESTRDRGSQSLIATVNGVITEAKGLDADVSIAHSNGKQPQYAV